MAWDAIVVGAGPNGLTAANHLADAGWSVLVLEAQPEVGGAVRSDREVDPAFVHDTFSAFYPLAAASTAVTSLGLERFGLRWRHAPTVLGHPLPNGDWALIDRDRTRTADQMERQQAGDGEAWLELCRSWDKVGDQLIAGLLTPFPPVRAGLRGLTRLRSAGGLDFVRLLLTPALDLGLTRFNGVAPRILLAGNAGHSDIPLTSPGSGLMAVLMSMLAQTVGFPAPEGGAGQLSRALARRFEAAGGEIQCGAEVTEIRVESGRAVGVRIASGESIPVRKAVLADVVASRLYGGLVPAAELPRRTRSAMKRFQLDPGTVKVDWALDGPVPWSAPPPTMPGTVHVGDSVGEIAESLGQVAAGVVPARPFMLAGLMTTTDASRSPAGTESMWAYTHVPHVVHGDAGDEGLEGRWDSAELERMADRMQARFERLAPGFSSRIQARRILGPHELEARDANLVGGSIGGGTSQLHQQLVFRPVPGRGRAETPIKGLYLGSSSAHPGGGVHGACGMNAAKAALFHERLRLRR
jgi:phytoene dehydrogenase-like protein